MRTIAIINQKGGCGKTTVSINLAAVLASQERRTLLVDVDPQGHCAIGLAVPEAQIEQSVTDLLRAGLDGSVASADVIWQITRYLDLAPSTMELAALQQELSAAPDRDRRLTQVLSTVADNYDFCVIDCPPSIGVLTFNALRAAGEVIIPVETGYFALQGSRKQAATIEMLGRRIGHQVRFSVLPTMYDVRTKLAREILAELRRHFGERLLPVVVHFNSKLKEAASFGQPIAEYDPTSRGMQDFERLATWLVTNPPPAVDRPVARPSVTDGTISRAAELVERARALTARTNALVGKSEPEPPARAAPHAPQPARNPSRPSQAQRLARAFGVRPTHQGTLFVQPARNGTCRVAIAGDFNNWSPTATPLQRHEKLDVFQACVPLPPGRYCYRLVVDGTWRQDPYNTYVEANPFGELNNVVEVKVNGD